MKGEIKLNKGKRGLVDDYNSLPPEESNKNNEYANDVLLQKKVLAELRKYPKGASSNQIARAMKIHHQTAMKILETLSALREAYDIRYGGIKLFFPNGTLNHPINFQDIKIDEKVYSFSEIVQYITGKRYIFIQEKEMDNNNLLEPKGGLLLKEEELARFIELLDQFQEELKARRNIPLVFSEKKVGE